MRAGRYAGLPEALRAIDTRQSFGFVAAGQTLEVDLTPFVPDDASSVVVNLTATECLAPGYFTAFPFAAATVPRASSLNVNFAGETRAAAVIVPIATQPDGRRLIKVYALQPAKLIVDVSGYFTSGSSPLSEIGLFVPVDPERILDTRDPGQIGRLWPGWTVEGGGAGCRRGGRFDRHQPHGGVLAWAGVPHDLAGPRAEAVDVERQLRIAAAGGVQPRDQPGHRGLRLPGVLRGRRPRARRLHGVLHRHAGRGPDPAARRTRRRRRSAPEWTPACPRSGSCRACVAGDSQRITDAGDSWHWTGTGYMGQDAHVASFAHRTTHGGPYRYLHFLSAGDEFTLTTADRREYTYQVVRRDLTNGNVTNILNATRFHPGTTYSMIACTRTDFTPTSTAWRIVVTGALIGWREL